MRNFFGKLCFLTLLLTAFAATAQQVNAPHDTLTIPDDKPAPDSPDLHMHSITVEQPQQEDTTPPISSIATPPAVISEAPESAPTIDGFGVLDDKNGGMPADIWKDSSYESASTLLSWMHGGVSYQPLREITVRLLTSQTNPPVGAHNDWFTDRVNALIAMGADDKAEEMIAAVPPTFITDSLEQVHAELMLLRGETDTACKLAEKMLTDAGTSANPLVWQKISIFCKALNGKRDEASVALDVLREANAKEDAFLQDLVRRMSDKNYLVKSFPAHWSILDVAMMRLAGESEQLKDKIEIVPPVTLKYFVNDTTLDPKLRDKAENKAILSGILPLKDANKTPLPPFSIPLASDVTTLVTALGSGNPATDADSAVIARLAVDENASILDSRRVLRLLTLMEPFGYRVAPETWNKLFAHKQRYDGDIAPAALIDRLGRAALAGRKGEVIVLSALILSSSDIERLSEAVLLPVIRALNATGYTKEARTLAYDAVQSYRAH